MKHFSIILLFSFGFFVPTLSDNIRGAHQLRSNENEESLNLVSVKKPRNKHRRRLDGKHYSYYTYKSKSCKSCKSHKSYKAYPSYHGPTLTFNDILWTFDGGLLGSVTGSTQLSVTGLDLPQSLLFVVALLLGQNILGALPATSIAGTPSSFPSLVPSVSSNPSSSYQPSSIPSQNPSVIPSNIPSRNPSIIPSLNPSPRPPPRGAQDEDPLANSVLARSFADIQSNSPSFVPLQKMPSPSPPPTPSPTSSPTPIPTPIPTVSPIDVPTSLPTSSPTISPTTSFSDAPTPSNTFFTWEVFEEVSSTKFNTTESPETNFNTTESPETNFNTTESPETNSTTFEIFEDNITLSENITFDEFNDFVNGIEGP